MRNPNGYGTIRKLTGKRKRPFGVYVTTGYETCRELFRYTERYFRSLRAGSLMREVNSCSEARRAKRYLTPTTSSFSSAIS